MELKRIRIAPKTPKLIFTGFERDLDNFEFDFKINKDCYLHIPKKFYDDEKYKNFLENLNAEDRAFVVEQFRLKTIADENHTFYEAYYDMGPCFLICEPAGSANRKFLICMGMGEMTAGVYGIFIQGIFEIIQ